MLAVDACNKITRASAAYGGSKDVSSQSNLRRTNLKKVDCSKQKGQFQHNKTLVPAKNSQQQKHY